MKDIFKINIYFDEKGEEIEKIISRLIIEKFLSLQHLNSRKNKI